METDIFLSSLNLPARCELGKTIFKKQFYDNAGLSAADKKLITNNVEKVIWQYCLKPDTINIQPYIDDEHEFLEVQVIEARLKKDSRHQRIAEIIMRAIPYPVILQLTYNNKLMIAAGIPRINLADNQKHTIEEFVFSPWIGVENLSREDQDFLASIKASNLSFTNIFRFYSDFVDQLHLINAAKLAGKTLQGLDPQAAQRAYEEITVIDKQLIALRAKMKKESMFNRKVELNVEVKQLQARQKKIRSSLQSEEIN